MCFLSLSLFLVLFFLVGRLCLQHKEIPFVLVCATCIYTMPIGHRHTYIHTYIHTVCSSFFLFRVSTSCSVNRRKEIMKWHTWIYIYDDKEWKHFLDFLWCHHHQLKYCLYKHKYIHVSTSFIHSHALRFRIYIYIYISRYTQSIRKKIYVICAKAMWMLINIMQMHRSYVLVMIEWMNARIYYY
jgi:hypothetical protein